LTTVAIHQPNYVPWPGYFHKLAAADVFVYLDAVQYPRGRSFAARNRIKTPNGVTYLTVPVSVPKGGEGKASYLEVAFADEKWRKKHLATVEQSYGKARHFGDVFPLYEREVEAGETLVGLNIGLIEAFASYLGIETRRVRLSELLPDFGQKTDLIVDVCRALGADAYLSGSGGGREYTDEAVLREHGLDLRFDEFEYPRYEQLWGDFEPNLSVLDVLFNCGPESRALILGD
jgi:WbqC-like protein